MRFEFEGNTYRILFKHDKSIELGQHLGHTLHVKHHPRLGVVAECYECDIVIGRVPLTKALCIRRTHCTIQALINTTQKWADSVSGDGTPNLDAGDTFNRTKGRTASLKNALYGTSPAFKEMAWKAFNERK